MQKIEIPIVPGGMYSDIAETELGANQHVEVRNLRITKAGEWETVKGYKTYLGLASGLINGIEFTLDETDERFLLLHSTNKLYRIDYNNGYDWAARQELTLPSGVTILPTKKLRFFPFRNVIRITGAVDSSDNTVEIPLWYGYIKREIEQKKGSTDYGTYTIDGWYLTKSFETPAGYLNTIDAKIRSTSQRKIGGAVAGDISEYKKAYLKFFFIIDEGQYSLPQIIVHESALEYVIYTTNFYHVYYYLTIEFYSSFVKNYPRISGIGILVAESQFEENDKDDLDNLDWRIADIFDLTDQENLKYVYSQLRWDSSRTPKYDASYDPAKVLYTQEYEDTAENAALFAALVNMCYPDRSVTIAEKTGNNVQTTINSTNTAQIVRYNNGTSDVVIAEIYLNDDLTSLGMVPGADTQLSFSFEKIYYNGTSIFSFLSQINLLNISSYESYENFTQIPVGSQNIAPAYSHHVVAGERAFVVSKEEGEEDVIRYSPPFQYDVFPDQNIMQTEVGDADRVLAIVKREDRLMALKRHSVSQFSYVGNSYSEDIGLAKLGLYATDGFIVFENTLIWMDKNDIWMFYGTQPQPLMRDEKMRAIFREYVSEDSFLAYDRLNNELYVFLDGIILVLNFDNHHWYIRDTDVSPLFAFIDKDKNLIVGTESNLLNFDNEESTFDESISYSIKTRIVDLNTPDYTKKTDELIVPVKSNDDVKITLSDPNQSTTKSVTKTPDANEIKAKRFRHRYLFKQLQLEISNVNAKNDLYANFRTLLFKLGIWK